MSEDDEEIRARTRRLEREEFERGHREPGAPPVTPRPAATMVLARPAGSDFEVLLLKRPEDARFAAGAWVFAGGRVDPEDADRRVLSRLRSGDPPEVGRALSAAIREQFEETGLLAGTSGPGRAGLRGGRRALLEGSRGFGEILEQLEMDFRGLDVAYFARWITPAKLALRYDARFFLARHTGGEPELTDELVEARWETPGRALAAFTSGELPMLFPTRKTLETLARFGTLEDALETLRRRGVETVRPRLLVTGEGVEPVLPGDRGYEEAAGQEPAPGGDEGARA